MFETPRARDVIVPPVTETVTGTIIVVFPSEIVIVALPLPFAPMPMDVATNVPDDAGAETDIDA
jgi:hypothetical protein